MKNWLFVTVLMFVFGQASAADDAELAQQAREILSRPSNAAGFVEEQKCFSLKPEKGKKGKKAPAKQKCTKELKSLDVVLAIRRDGDKDFTLIEAVGSGPNLCVSKTTGFETRCRLSRLGKTNGVNTEFEIERPTGYKVYAIRRVVNDPGGRKEAVYTPYSEKLNTAGVRRAGIAYVESVIDKATRELRAHGVRSLIDPRCLVADLAPKEVIRRLVLIEHIDEDRFRREGFSVLVKEVYTTYGLNQGIAYNYAVSSAKARGMFQIIPKTYQAMRTTYPTAKLKENFIAGTKDHVNAAMAAILLADHDVSLLPKAMRPSIFAGSGPGDYIASSYNGGPSRPIRILKTGGDLVKNNPNPENKTYVLKMRATSAVRL